MQDNKYDFFGKMFTLFFLMLGVAALVLFWFVMRTLYAEANNCGYYCNYCHKYCHETRLKVRAEENIGDTPCPSSETNCHSVSFYWSNPNGKPKYIE